LPVPANATLASLFPDEDLRRMAAEVSGRDANLTGQALSDRLARVEIFNVRSRGIGDATGIEYLIGLTHLELGFN